MHAIRVSCLTLLLAFAAISLAAADEPPVEQARDAPATAVDALAARDMPDGVADVERMTEANLYETERPPVYAAIFSATYDATGEERFLQHFLAVADLCVAMKQPEGDTAASRTGPALMPRRPTRGG